MVGKDARGMQARSINWKLWGSFIVGASILAAACLAMRQFGRPGAASAQAPAGNRAPQNRSSNQQTGRTAGPIAVLAVVNGQQITRQHLAEESVARYGKEVLETLVNKTLILEATKRKGIAITQKDVEEEIARLARTFNLTVDNYLSLLQNERDISPQQIARDMIWPTLAMRRLVEDQIQLVEKRFSERLNLSLGRGSRRA